MCTKADEFDAQALKKVQRAIETASENVVGQTHRPTARGVIKDMINGHERKAAQLRALLDALPAKLPYESDEALWSVLTNPRRP